MGYSVKALSHWRASFGARLALLLFLVASAGSAAAADVIVYDESLQNDFLNFSYNGTFEVASTLQAHTGTHSIEFTSAGGFAAVKVANNTTLFDTATHPRLQLWFYGTQAQCQALDVVLERDNGPIDDFLASGALGAYTNNCITLVPGQWAQIVVDFTAQPIGYDGTYDRISFYDRNGGAFGPVYFDDITLLATPDEIFKAGFDGNNLPPPACGMTDEHDVTAGGMLSDRFDWCDSAGNPRVAVLAHNDGAVAGPGGTRGGELREFRYETGAGTRIVAAPARDDGGFGYVVSHPLGGNCVGGDSSSLGHFFSGTWTRVFEGRHHAIFRFQQNYPRYCTLAPPAAEHDIPVTIDWVFSTGRDDPLWAVTFDMSGFAADTIADDSRAPYGTMNIDGSAGTYMDNDVGGIGWGDRFRFSTTSVPATMSSSWNWGAANQVPFVELWTSGVDATMGLAQSQTMSQQDAGGGRQPFGAGSYDVSAYWGATSAGGKACPTAGIDQQTGVAHNLPCIGYWPYQANSFSYTDIVNPTNDAKMTWGTQYGFLGQTAYDLHDSTLPGGSTASGWPKKSYSLYVVLGVHGADPVAARVTQVQTLQTVSLTINGGIGSVATGGPAGVNRADTIDYAPTGYDPVYGALTFDVGASNNALDANIAVGAGTLEHPLIVVRGFSSGTYPTSVKLNGNPLVVDVDYFPSLRAGWNELWMTLNKDLGGAANELQIIP
jgi:hypothetical protein